VGFKRTQISVTGILCFVIPVIVVLSLWMPVIGHYYVPTVGVSNEMMRAARVTPADGVLEELQNFRFSDSSIQDEEGLVATGEKILDGVLDRSSGATTDIVFPFDPKDLKTPGPQLFLASFGVPRILLEAYKASGHDKFLQGAKDVILAWAEYENSAWLPTGLLWNDHAIAERMLVLAEFWRLYRRHPDHELEVAKTVLQLAARQSRLLAKPFHFTFNTNHGIMQNLALLHYFLAFPSLPDAERYKDLALSRLRDQMQFYVNDEGVVLEHSAGYQNFGIRLMAMAMRYATLSDVSIPAEWIAKYHRAQEVSSHLRRPDGTLPIFGDTGSGRSRVQLVDLDWRGRASAFRYEESWRPHHLHSLYPVAGYSIWWDGLEKWPQARHLSQLAVTWSYFPGHAHKHADEMSLSLWSAEQRWITNIGYWPYGVPGRREAVSWSGSNAPHGVDEENNSSRETNLQYFASSERLAFIDLERKEATGYNARRQIIWKKPNIWVVVDRVSCNGHSRSRTVWNTTHDVRLEKGPIPGWFDLYGPGGKVLTGIFFGYNEIRTLALRGSDPPFAGWEVSKGKGVPAPAILVEQPCNDSVSAVAWVLNDGKVSGTGGRLNAWQGPEEWAIEISLEETGTIKLQRKLDRLVVRASAEELLNLRPAPDVSAQRQQIYGALAAAADKYPRFNDNYRYRMKATQLLIFLFFIQGILLLCYQKIYGKHYSTLKLITVGYWLVGGFILVTFFDWLVESFTGMGLPF
jgi:hypothetical protein